MTLITGKTIFAAVGILFCTLILGCILGTAVELFDEWRSKHD